MPYIAAEIDKVFFPNSYYSGKTYLTFILKCLTSLLNLFFFLFHFFFGGRGWGEFEKNIKH